MRNTKLMDEFAQELEEFLNDITCQEKMENDEEVGITEGVGAYIATVNSYSSVLCISLASESKEVRGKLFKEISAKADITVTAEYIREVVL